MFCLSYCLTICWMRWKLLPWKPKACSNMTLSSVLHSSGKGVKLAKSASERSTSCLCHNNMPRACGRETRGWGQGTPQQQTVQCKVLNRTVLFMYLLHVVAVFLFCHEDVLIHWIEKTKQNKQQHWRRRVSQSRDVSWRAEMKCRGRYSYTWHQKAGCLETTPTCSSGPSHCSGLDCLRSKTRSNNVKI